jgi:hypothetical protein
MPGITTHAISVTILVDVFVWAIPISVAVVPQVASPSGTIFGPQGALIGRQKVIMPKKVTRKDAQMMPKSTQIEYRRAGTAALAILSSVTHTDVLISATAIKYTEFHIMYIFCPSACIHLLSFSSLDPNPIEAPYTASAVSAI